MARQAPVDESDDARELQSVEDHSDRGSGTNDPQQVERERRSSTPVSVAHKNLPSQDEEVQILKLLQTRKLRLEEARIEREGEIEARRIQVEEDREARLQRNEDRQAQIEGLRIASQKAQTELMLKMLEVVQKKLQ
jgi:hypothetical protein